MPNDNVALNGDWIRMAAGVVLLFLTVGAVAWFLFRLRREFYQGCKDDGQLAIFAQSPLGLPSGSVRSSLALIIVVFAVGYIIISGKTNEALMAVLGSVLGFYFGSQTASKQGGLGGVVETQMNQIKTDKEKQTVDKVNGLLKDIDKGLALSKVAVNVLPADAKKKCEKLIERLDVGYNAVKGLIDDGKVDDAASMAQDLFNSFKGDNPAKDVVSRALSSFGKVLGSGPSALAIVGTIVGVGSRLSGIFYDKWKARILHAPFSPAVFQPAVVDASTGFVLLAKCPTFKETFIKQLEAQDAAFMDDAARTFLFESDPEKIWQKYKAHFESRADFERGLEEFRRVAADREISAAVEAPLVSAVGGYENLVETIDSLHEDPDATGDLDALVTVFETLQRNGKSPEAVFAKVKSEVES